MCAPSHTYFACGLDVFSREISQFSLDVSRIKRNKYVNGRMIPKPMAHRIVTTVVPPVGDDPDSVAAILSPWKALMDRGQFVTPISPSLLTDNDGVCTLNPLFQLALGGFLTYTHTHTWHESSLTHARSQRLTLTQTNQLMMSSCHRLTHLPLFIAVFVCITYMQSVSVD